MKALASRLTTLGLSEQLADAFLRSLLIVGFAGLTAAASLVRIPIPGTTVPATLQTAVVLLAGLLLGRRDGALSQVVYLLGGSLGLPFFAGVTGLFGPTGGYLFGFVLAAFCAGSFEARGSFLRAWVIAFGASFAVFVPGVIVLKIFAMTSWEQALMMGLLPFLIGDVVKVSLAATIYSLRAKQA